MNSFLSSIMGKYADGRPSTEPPKETSEFKSSSESPEPPQETSEFKSPEPPKETSEFKSPEQEGAQELDGDKTDPIPVEKEAEQDATVEDDTKV